MPAIAPSGEDATEKPTGKPAGLMKTEAKRMADRATGKGVMFIRLRPSGGYVGRSPALAPCVASIR